MLLLFAHDVPIRVASAPQNQSISHTGTSITPPPAFGGVYIIYVWNDSSNL